MSWIHGPLLGVDTETTSADPRTALPVSYAFVLRRDTTRMSIDTALVDPGVEIPEEATAIHGITTERARAEGRPLGEAMEHVKARILWAEAEQIPLVGQNVSFDLTIIDRLAGLSGWGGKVLDTFVLDKAAYKWRKGSRSLSALAEVYDVEPPTQLGGDHSAATDAATAVMVLERMVAVYDWIGRCSPADLHRRQVTWYRQQQEDLSEHFVEQGKEPIPPEDFGWPVKSGALEQEAC